MIDYRELLKSYMELIYACESISFVDHLTPPFHNTEMPSLNKGLILELQKIDSELRIKLDYD